MTSLSPCDDRQQQQPYYDSSNNNGSSSITCGIRRSVSIGIISSSGDGEDNDDNSTDDMLLLLPDDIWRIVLMFVGIGQYRFVALTSKRLHKLYRSLFELHGCFFGAATLEDSSVVFQQQQENTTLYKMNQTHMSSVVESISRCEMFLKEKQQQEHHSNTMMMNCTSFSSSIEEQQHRSHNNFGERRRRINYCRSQSNDKSDELLRRIARFAALHGNLDVLKFTVSKSWGDYLQRDTIICRNAILGGHYHILSYCKSNGFK